MSNERDGKDINITEPINLMWNGKKLNESQIEKISEILENHIENEKESLNSRLLERAKAEDEFTKCIALLDVTPTKEILEVLNHAIMCGVEPKQIINVIQTLTIAKDLNR